MKKTLPAEVTLAPGDTISWSQYTVKKAKQLTERYKAQKYVFSPEKITILAVKCLNDMQMAEEDEEGNEEPACVFNGLESICTDLHQSEEYTNMTDNETVSAAFAPSVMEREVNTQEIAIIQAAKNTGLHNGYTELSKRFDFGENMCDFKLREGAIASPADYGAIIGIGCDMGNKGRFLAAAGALRLSVMGHENVLPTIADALNIKYSTLSNWLRTFERTPKQFHSLPFTTLVEIATAKFDDDPKKDQEVREELLNDADLQRWNAEEARSHVKMRKGHDETITDGGKKIKYRYLLVMPGSEPMLCIEEPAWSAGVLVVDLKTQEWLRDVENKISYCQIAKEPIFN